MQQNKPVQLTEDGPGSVVVTDLVVIVAYSVVVTVEISLTVTLVTISREVETIILVATEEVVGDGHTDGKLVAINYEYRDIKLS